MRRRGDDVALVKSDVRGTVMPSELNHPWPGVAWSVQKCQVIETFSITRAATVLGQVCVGEPDLLEFVKAFIG